MFQVKCPNCQKFREVKSKQPWMVGNPPYEKLCKSCCQVGKEKTEDHKRKLSESVKKTQTEEVLKKKSEFMKSHPEVWSANLIAGQGAGWNEGMELPERSDETKEKISESMKARRNK
jgi:hypothetical protein